MSDETLSHIKLEFNRNAAQIVKWLAVGPETLRRAQCDQMQGYLISRPVPREAITDMLRKR